MQYRGVSARQRWALLGAFAAVLAALVVPSLGFADEEIPAEDSSPALLNPDDFSSLPDPQMPEQPSPSETAESETAYAGLSDDAALDVAREQFAEVLHADLVPELKLDIGQPGGEDLEVDKYFGSYAARIVEEGHDEPYGPGDGPNPNTLVQSSIPLRAPEAGDLRPLDSDLERVGDHFEADNPVVDSEISTDLDQGVELPAAEVAVAPEGTAETTAEPVADKVFFANAEEDSDYLIAPAATGAEILIQLRSVESPESFALDIEMPAGATLESTPDGGAAVTDGEQTVVTVEPPRALDAAGQQVATHYEIAGDQLTVAVDHRDAETLYPIMVDPFIDYYPFDGASTGDNGTWDISTPYPGRYSSFYTDQHNGALINRAVGGKSVSWGETTEWYAKSIRDTSIERVDYFNFDHTSSSPALCTFLGIWQPGSGTWTNSNVVWDPALNATSTSDVYSVCGNTQWMTRYFVVGFNDGSDGSGGDPEAQLGSQGRWILVNWGNGYRSTNADARLRSANIYRVDTNKPWVSWESASSGQWEKNLKVDAHDNGLGVASVWIWGTNSSGSPAVVGYGNTNCLGSHLGICPQHAGSVVVDNLPEGRHTYTAAGIDPVLNAGAGNAFTARIDRSGPSISTSGSLASAEATGQSLTDPSYGLTIHTTDGDTSSPAAERSGVKSVAVSVDGAQRNRIEQPCPAGSCALDMDWIMVPGDYTPGSHTIRVEAVDQLGNTSSRTLQVQVGQATCCGSDTVYYAPSTVFKSSSVQTVDGTKLSGGACEGDFEYDARYQSTPYVGAAELAYSPSTCKALVATGPVLADETYDQAGAVTLSEPSSAATPSAGTSWEDGSVWGPEESMTSTETESAGTSGANSCCPRLVVQGHARYEDPVSINVAAVHSRIKYSPTSACAFPGGTTAVLSWRRQWYSPTGWSPDQDHPFVESGANCNRITYSVDSAFTNQAFCNPFSSTHVSFKTDLKARAAGVVSLSVHFHKDGDCARLLHHEDAVYVKAL